MYFLCFLFGSFLLVCCFVLFQFVCFTGAWFLVILDMGLDCWLEYFLVWLLTLEVVNAWQYCCRHPSFNLLYLCCIHFENLLIVFLTHGLFKVCCSVSQSFEYFWEFVVVLIHSVHHLPWDFVCCVLYCCLESMCVLLSLVECLRDCLSMVLLKHFVFLMIFFLSVDRRSVEVLNCNHGFICVCF